MTDAEVNAVADGRVFTGDQALAAGLIDALGGLEPAIERCAELAGYKEDQYEVVYLGTDPVNRLFTGFGALLHGTEPQTLLPVSPTSYSPVMYLYAP